MLHILICGIILLGIFLFQFYFPVAYNYFVSEDSWVEYGTFVCYMTAGLLVLGAMTRDRSMRRPGYMLLCLGLFFVAMEEISWGQRLLGIRTPGMIAQYNAQSELSLHNASFFPAEHLFFYAILIWSVILPEISYYFKRLDMVLKAVGIPLVSRELYPYFIAGFLLKKYQIVIRNAELGEFIVSLAFLLFSIEVFYRTCKSSEEINLAERRIIGWALIIVLIVTTTIVLLGPQDIYALKRLLHKSAMTEYPRYEMNAQAQRIFEYLIQHEKFKNDDTLFQYGLFLKKTNKNEAEGIFKEALKETKARMLQNPDKPAPNILAGKILKELNQPDLAQKEFTEALRKDQIRLAQAKLDWQRVDALKSMGEAYIEMGNYELAKERLQKAYEYAEDGGMKATIKKLLKALSADRNL